MAKSNPAVLTLIHVQWSCLLQISLAYKCSHGRVTSRVWHEFSSSSHLQCFSPTQLSYAFGDADSGMENYFGPHFLAHLVESVCRAKMDTSELFFGVQQGLLCTYEPCKWVASGTYLVV